MHWPASDWHQYNHGVYKTVCRTDELLFNFSRIETLIYNEEQPYCWARLMMAIGIADLMLKYLLKAGADGKERQWILDNILGLKNSALRLHLRQAAYQGCDDFK
jgi:hypothetical protein